MSVVEDIPRTITVEEFLALPEDGFDRDIIRDELREWPMTLRNGDHSEIEINIGHLLKVWSDAQPGPRGKVVGGECAFRLRVDPTTFVGIDVAYVSPELAASRKRNKQWYFDGPPVLAVEILSPSDRHEDIVTKIGAYLETGVVVWLVDPDFRTVAIHRSGRPVETLNDRQELDGDPELPGFRVAVARLFDG